MMCTLVDALLLPSAPIGSEDEGTVVKLLGNYNYFPMSHVAMMMMTMMMMMLSSGSSGLSQS